MEQIKPSISEDHGVAFLRDTDLEIYSVGISTCGVAEIRMAQAQPGRHIIATTIDEEGLQFTLDYINEHGFSKQVEGRLEDVAQPLPYDDNTFDYIYARLVLHYLTKQQLEKTLVELRRVLKDGGRLFVVVRSVTCSDAQENAVEYDSDTGLTTYTSVDPETHKSAARKRYFHTKESMTDYLQQAGFEVTHIEAYIEQLAHGFLRKRLSDNRDEVIELLATKQASPLHTIDKLS